MERSLLDQQSGFVVEHLCLKARLVGIVEERKHTGGGWLFWICTVFGFVTMVNRLYCEIGE